MYKKIRKQAEKKVEAKMSFYVCTIVFSFASLVLVMLSYFIPEAAYWFMLPIPILVMVLAVLYFFAFGLPNRAGSFEDWKEEEIEKEMIKLYRRERVQLPPKGDISETDILELKELERLKHKWEGDDEFV